MATVQIKRKLKDIARKYETLGRPIHEFDSAQCVKLPEGVDRREWWVSNAAQFYIDLDQIVAIVTNPLIEGETTMCTAETCPTTQGSSKNYTYLWPEPTPEDPDHRVSLPAPEYMRNVLTFASTKLDDEAFAPSGDARLQAPGASPDYAEDFDDVMGSIFRRFYRVYAHIYNHHYKALEQLDLHRHLNHVFRRLVLFLLEFDLLPAKEVEKPGMSFLASPPPLRE